MVKLLWAILFVLTGSLAYFLLGGGRGLVAPPSPAIWIANEQVELGRLRPNSSARHSVRIENRGGQPLIIKQLIPSCSCAEADLANPLIAPGASADVSFTLNTRPASGPGRESMLVVSNDPNNPHVKIDILFSVGESVLVEPRSLDFGDVERGQLPQSVSATLIANEAKRSLADLTIRGAEKPLAVRLDLPDRDGRRRLMVTLGPETPTGQVYGTVEVLESGDSSPIRVDVHGYVRGEVLVMPRTILFESGGAGAETSAQSVTLSARKGNLAVASHSVSESLSKLVKVSLTRNDARSYRADIAVEKTELPAVWRGAKRLSGNVLFECSTEQARQEMVAVPILIFVEPRRKQETSAPGR